MNHDDYPEPTYCLEDGRYAFYLCGKRLFATDEVAFLFDERCSTLLKHGSPAVVRAFADQIRARYAAAGIPELTKDNVLLQGKFAIDDLNNVVRICDFIGVLYLRLKQEFGQAPAAV